jgi:hypothetical protein
MSTEDLSKKISNNEINFQTKPSIEIDLNNNEKKNNLEDILVEKTINKWLNLQKIIKEEITLEDVIIKQQQDDTKDLKSFFVKYYQIKLNTRKNWNDIKKLKLDDKQNNISSYIINQEIGGFHDASEPLKNLFFLLRNNYDYLTRLISLINPEDFTKNINSINSLVELLNNNFYENILIPNPEQQELLILIYKLLEEEIIPMGGVCPQNFLKDDTFIGIFLSSFAKKQEIIGYFSMILNSLILSIDNDDSKEFFDLSINNIVKSLDLEIKEKRRSSTKNNIEYKKIGSEMNMKEILFGKIPKINIKFKNSFELEAEKEKEDEMKYILDDDNILEDGKNICYIRQKRKATGQKNRLQFGNKDNEFNKNYKSELTQNRLIEKIGKETDPELKEVYKKLLEQINYYPNKFTNEGLLKILKSENDKKSGVIENYRYNFLYIRETIEELLQLIIDKIITLPYPLRCICKIINILISKKFPHLSKYEVNSFIGKFILDKCIFPILRLENKIFLEPRVYSKKTKNCLDVIISVLSKANSSSLFDTYLDPEKTIFNQFILEIIPILNKFYEKIIDIKLPKVIDDLINKTVTKLEDSPHKKIFNFRTNKQRKDSNILDKKNAGNSSTQVPLYEYFKENSDEILHLQSVCFSVEDVKFILELIGRDIEIFKDLERYPFFTKTYKKIKNENEIINGLYKEDDSTQKKTFYVIFKDEKNSILEQLVKQKKKGTSTFLSSEQDSELICKRVKFCIKTILKGLNLLNNKDFAYLNFAQSSDKFFSALKYTLEELGEYNELSNDIPLKWYSQYIYNYKKELDIEYQKEDFAKLYSEISTEETNILNELKKLSNIVITRDGMNLRCAEKIIDRSMYELKRIEEAKKFNQLEKFINTKKVEVCITQTEESIKNIITDKILPVSITEIKSCPYNINNNSLSEKGHCHLNNINDFINIFADNTRMKLKEMIKMDISKSERKYKISEIIGKYMEFVVKKIKDNKTIFGELKDEEIKSFYKKIENHIIRKIYKYTFPKQKLNGDTDILNATRSLEWIQPENLDIKKLYVNQLKFAEKYINRINDAKSVFDKLDCIQNAYVIMNNTVKFISGKNENAGQDEFTPLFQYILIKSQPEKLVTNINYIKCFLSDVDLMGQNGFYFSQMESACTFIKNIKSSDLKMEEKEFNEKREKYRRKYERKESDKNNNKKMKLS